jgi:SAM-dependent methyltransferase
MGSLGSTAPVDANFGYGRGTPIDRYYIEQFLDRHAGDITGHALEVGDASYCIRFGTGIARQDVLHVSPENSHATIIGDLAQDDVLPASSFDCIVLTQTLHLIYDMPKAVEQLHRALKPGGVALVTVPGITSIDTGEWGDSWYWALTRHSATRLFGEAFGASQIEVDVRGNVYAATTFLQGLALEEVDRGKLDVVDQAYPVVVSVRAVRAV